MNEALSELVEATAIEYGIPGVAVGVWANGQERFACHGVTSTEHPLPVDRDTLFLLGSITKTYTATAVMQLVADGRVELDAAVRHYLPELELAAEITVLHLLAHTSGLDWGLIVDTGEGDDALARYVAQVAELPVLAPPGARASYSQAGYNVAGRIVEKVTGLTYERVVLSRSCEPLGMAHTFFARDDIMTRRFAVGHNRGDDGTLSIARLWRRSRGDNPGGGMASSVADQLRWARCHLGEGGAVLSSELLQRMKEPTVALRGSNLGDAIGIGWFLRDVDGVRTFGHAGSANGQFAELLAVPDRKFAVVALANAGPNGIPFNRAVVRWALHAYLGLTERDPQPLAFAEARARELVGSYHNDVMTLVIGTTGTGLWLEVRIKPEIRAAADKELPPDHAPFDFGLLPGDTGEYIITSGAFAGQRGFFTRDPSGAIIGIDLAGRLFHRTPP